MVQDALELILFLPINLYRWRSLECAVVLLDLVNIYHWMNLYGFRQFLLAGIIPNHCEYWEWSNILWLEGACLSLELEIPNR